jgi:hypothetical protein
MGVWLVPETFLVLRRIQQGIIINVIGLHVTYLLSLSDFNETEFSWQIF